MLAAFEQGNAMNANTQHDIGKLLLRVTLGVLILFHGLSKLNGGMGGIVHMVEAHGLPGALGYGVLLGEVIGPLMLIAGFHARIGAVLVFINMVVAVLLVHMGQIGSFNDQGGWALELQAMYLVSALALALLGPGRFSVNER
ncbi:DoxX family protein [Lysobacter sp. PAGU 2638]